MARTVSAATHQDLLQPVQERYRGSGVSLPPVFLSFPATGAALKRRMMCLRDSP